MDETGDRAVPRENDRFGRRLAVDGAWPDPSRDRQPVHHRCDN